MSKTRAYSSENGSKTISANQLSIEKDRLGHLPTDVMYYSTHKPGNRQRVFLKKSSKGLNFFSYYNNMAGTSESGVSGGESLNHLLFKEAICSLQHVMLKLYINGKFLALEKIKIIQSRCEEKITLDDGSTFYADVYLKFKLENHPELQYWTGDLYIEVFNTHAVDKDKLDKLRRNHIPVIEVPIPNIFTYKISDEKTSDNCEKNHREKIKRVLESEKGFLISNVLSNFYFPNYFKSRLREQNEKLHKLKAINENIKAQIDITNAEMQELEKHARSCKQLYKSADLKLRNAQEQLRIIEGELDIEKMENTQHVKDITKLNSQKKLYFKLFSTMLFLSVSAYMITFFL